MSAAIEFDTEIYLPVRLELTVDEEGEIELVGLTPLANFLPGITIDPSTLPVRERRVLLAEAAQMVEAQAADAELERRASKLNFKRGG